MTRNGWVAILILSGAAVLTWFITAMVIALSNPQADPIFLYIALIPAIAVALLVGGLLLMWLPKGK